MIASNGFTIEPALLVAPAPASSGHDAPVATLERPVVRATRQGLPA